MNRVCPGAWPSGLQVLLGGRVQGPCWFHSLVFLIPELPPCAQAQAQRERQSSPALGITSLIGKRIRKWSDVLIRGGYKESKAQGRSHQRPTLEKPPGLEGRDVQPGEAGKGAGRRASHTGSGPSNEYSGLMIYSSISAA